MIDFHNQLSIIPQVYETATLQDNLEHSGGIDISWNAAENTEIPVGAYITYGGLHYILLEPYRPTKASAVHYKYSPHFKHPQNMLDRIPFWIKSRTVEGQEINLRTVSFTGYPQTLADKIVTFFEEYANETGDTYFRTVIGTNWTHNLQSGEGQAALNVSNLPVVTVNFDGSSIRSAVNALADAIGCNVFFDWNETNGNKTIRFIAGTTIDGETYNCFHVLGGTRNMGKVATSGGYAAVTQRLTLKETEYPGSIIDIRPGSSGIRLMQDLILDEVYPKMELYINPKDGFSPRPRNCYLTDEEGNRIEVVVPQGTTPPADAIQDPTDGKYYKYYTKWYIHLSYDAEGNNPYVFDREKLINDKPLTILFQPVYDDDNSHPLIGREFELTYFPTNATESERTEWTEDDVLPRTTPFVADPDSYRIIFKAEGETILPTTEGLGLIPQGGDLVTLVNMALSNEEIERAQGELETAALEIIKLYEQRKPDYTKTLIANAIPASASEAIPAIGQEKTIDGVTGIVTSINRNLDTDVADVAIGSWSRKTLTGGVHDKIDTVSVNGGKATESTEDKSSSFSDFETLMRTAPKPNIEKILTPMNQKMDEISQQADRAFDIWYGEGAPLSLAASPYAKNRITKNSDGTFTTANNTGNQYALALADLSGLNYDNCGKATITFNTKINSGNRLLIGLGNKAVRGENAYDSNKTNYNTGGLFLWFGTRDGVNYSLYNGVFNNNAFGEDVTTVITIDKVNNKYSYVLKNAVTGVVYFSGQLSGIPDIIEAYSWQNNLTFGFGKVAVNNGDPSGDWTTDEERDKHLHDIYIDTTWGASGAVDSGGRFYRYVKNGSTYKWQVITDLATINAIGLATQAMNSANDKVKVFVSESIPTPPYNVDDLWWKTDSNGVSGTMYRCTTAKVEGNSPDISDWTATVIPSESIINALLEFATTFEGNNGGEIMQDAIDSGRDYITVWFSDSTASSIGTNYDILFTPSNVYTKKGDTWGRYYDFEQNVFSVLKRINALRSGVFTSFRLWRSMNVASAASVFSLFDLYYRRGSYNDRFTGETIKGGLGVWVYGTQGWELLQDNTTSLQQNYGDILRSVVFGSDDTQSTASGIVTMKNFTEIFASAEAGDTTALAAIRTLVEYDEQTGLPTGKVLVSADRVDFDSSYVNIKGNLHASDDDIFIGKYSDNPNIDDVVIRFRRGDSGVFPGIDYLTLSGKDEITADFGFTRTGRIVVRGYKKGNTGDRYYCTDINKGIVFSNGFAALDIDEYAYYGVGTADSPETFDAIGKRITVRSGIITGITDSPIALFTDLSISNSQLSATIGGVTKSANLSDCGFLTKESRFYDSKSSFLNAYPNVTDEYEVVKYVAVLAKSGNYRLLAITMADTEGNSFNIYETSSSGQTLLWRSNTTRANEQTTALVWMDPNKSYRIDL